MKKGKLPPFAFDAGSIFIHRKPAAAAAAAAAAATTTSSKVPPPPLLCPLAFPLRQVRVFPSSFGPPISETLKSSSPHAASFGPHIPETQCPGGKYGRGKHARKRTSTHVSSYRILLYMCPYSRQAWPRKTDPVTSRQTLLLLLRQLRPWRYRRTPKPQPRGAPRPPKLRPQVTPTASLGHVLQRS